MHKEGPAQAGKGTKTLRRRTLTTLKGLALAGLAMLAAGSARAQLQESLRLGQPRTYRWNEQRTGYGFDPTGGALGFEGLLMTQMPAYIDERTITSGPDRGRTVLVANPDLQWYFPMDVEGQSIDDAPGNRFPIGYTLGEIRSSPTVGSVEMTNGPVLSVIFGSATTVRRDIRNSLPREAEDDPVDGRPNIYTTNGVYDANRDPYSYLQRERTGAIFGIEAFGGTNEVFAEGDTTVERRYKPLWWYGVRNLPWYKQGEASLDPTNPGDDSFHASPSLLQHRFFINASDTAMRAFDYAPSEARNPDGVYGPEPTKADQILRRQKIFTQYLSPALSATKLSGDKSGPGYDGAAGWVAPGRPDIPERVTDRLYNLNITGPRFGLSANSSYILRGSGKPDVDVGRLNNRFRQNNGIGPINSTGVLVRLTNSITYRSQFYNFRDDSTDAAVDALQKERRDPAKVQDATGLSTQYLYIVGSDDGYVYAFDADPRNARRVPASGGGALYSTHMGRLVWAFRAALRAPAYTYDSKGTTTLATMNPAPGEGPGTMAGGEHLDDKSSGLVVASGGIVSGPIVSSPVGTVINVPAAPSILTPALAGQNRSVVYVGSGIGRVFCLDASTGQEIWEFKTTPRGQTRVQWGSNNVLIDAVQGYAVTSSPTLGFVPGATSQLRPMAPAGRLAVFFTADDGKAYAVDAEDGSPLREDATLPGWDVDTYVDRGTVVQNMQTDLGTRSRMDHYGFVTYPFERKGTRLPSTTFNGDYPTGGKYGRRRSEYAKPLTASVVARPSRAQGYVEPVTGQTIPAVDMLFIASPTNQSDATVGDDPAFTGGTIFAVNPASGAAVWAFDRWEDVTRESNTDFDKNTAKDRFVRPAAFMASPAYASKINVFDESEGQNGNQRPLRDVNALFAVDANGRMFALRTDDNIASVNRLYWKTPYNLSGGPGQAGGVYSTPVVSTPNTEGDRNKVYADASYVFIGVSDGIVGVSTTAVRTDFVLGPNGQPLSGDDKYTGGEILWAYTTPYDGMRLNDTQTPPTLENVAEPRPVVTTPAIHMGYLWAGADNGLFYAWRNTESGFGYGNSGGNIPYRGGNRPRTPIQNPGSGGASTGSSSVEFYVDAFEAGFGYFPNFSPQGVKGITPTGAPLSTGSGAGVTPQPMGERFDEFKGPRGGVLEWGDPVAVVAWGPGLDQKRTEDGENGFVNFQISGPNTTGALRGGLEQNGSHTYARQIFYLNPFGSFVPAPMRYPGPLVGQESRNPLAGQNLPPGWRGNAITVRGFYQGPAYTDENGNRRQQAQVRARTDASTRFSMANPLNISAYFTGNTPSALVGSAPSLKEVYEQYPDAVRNGNKRVPVVASMVGDHGTATSDPLAGNLLRVLDRSNLNILRTRAASWGVPAEGLTTLALRVRVQPQQLRWMGGPQAAYKPLLVRNMANDRTGRPALPNGLPLPDLAPPEPMAFNYWGQQRASFWDVPGDSVYVGAEQPPYQMGETNRSLDYPDIDSGASSWMMLPNALSPTERDASAVDAPVPSVSAFYLKAAVPKYQPANYAPPNQDPSAANAMGIGPGYYTINPANMSAPAASMLGWNPGQSRNAAFYRAYDSPADMGSEDPLYWGPARTPLPPSATLAAQEVNYLSKVYVDVNGNGTPDVGNGEPYRMFVSGVQVRPDERLRVATTTISVPNDPETAIPGGYIPFPFYWDRQVASAGGDPARDGDLNNFGQRNLFAPFDVYNGGNVNLWNVRLSKYDPMGGHLLSPDVDPAAYAGASTLSNWPAAGVIKRFNLASTLDPLPISGSGNPGQGPAGSPNDSRLWTPAAKPSPAGMGDEGLGARMLVKDVFAFRQVNNKPVPERAHGAAGLDSPVGRPYISVAIPPGTTPGNYATEYGRLVLFEDSGPPYADRPYNGILDMAGNTPLEQGVSSDAVVTVRVAESRLTDKVSRYAPFLPQADAGVAMSGSFPSFNVNNARPADLAPVWQMLAQDATPSAYRDPQTGHLVTFWSSNRVGYQDGMNVTAIPPFSVSADAANKYHIFASAMRWQDPVNPPIDPAASVPNFLRDTLTRNPWGWEYQGGNMGSFFFPNFGLSSWFGQPTASPWLPSAATVNAALGLPDGSVGPLDLTYTAPAVITNFRNTGFPPVVFWTGSTGFGPDARSAIFYAPVRVDGATGRVTAGDIQAVGVTGGQRTLDPFATKYGPRPFLITAGGSLQPSGAPLPTTYLTDERVVGLGVAWFGGAPGAWKLYVSTIETDNSGNATGDGRWKTTQLPLPEGVSSAMHPSVYYYQIPKPAGGSQITRFGWLRVAFTGYSRSGRNPDVYVARYNAASRNTETGEISLGNWDMTGFAREGSSPGGGGTLEPMERVTGEPRPIYRSNWTTRHGRGLSGTTVYWFRKPVAAPGAPTRNDDFELYATFTARRGGTGGVVEAPGRLAGGGALRNVSAFIEAGGGIVRFATTDPVNQPAPLSRPYTINGRVLQDYIYIATDYFTMRVTTDDQISDSMPQVWLDETHEIITDGRRTTGVATPTQPLAIRRDRLWVLWRRAAQPEGATRISSLYYKTYRLGVDVGQPINVTAGKPDLFVTLANSDFEVTPVIADLQRGRVYFTGFNEGDAVTVRANGSNMGNFTVNWIPEDTDGPLRFGSGGGFRLPLTRNMPPRAVPTLEHRDDSQPWLFKDPFSDIPPGAPGYYQRANNNMWLFWSSTRPSRALGAPGTEMFDPTYWDPNLNALTYAGSASDIYYTTLSPDFVGR